MGIREVLAGLAAAGMMRKPAPVILAPDGKPAPKSEAPKPARPRDERRAQLLRDGAIRNHPSTEARRKLGWIGEHAYTAPRKR